MSYPKVNRPILYYIVHCAYTRPSMDISIDWIDKLHKKNGWSGVGYNTFFKRDGTRQSGRPLEQIGAHTLSFNHNSIGVCYAGGMGEKGGVEDNITVDQWFAIMDDFRAAQEVYPNILMAGHNQFNAKACPSFDVRDYCRKHGIEAYYAKEPLVKIPKK